MNKQPLTYQALLKQQWASICSTPQRGLEQALQKQLAADKNNTRFTGLFHRTLQPSCEGDHYYDGSKWIMSLQGKQNMRNHIKNDLRKDTKSYTSEEGLEVLVDKAYQRLIGDS